jgi:hypothetical protein
MGGSSAVPTGVRSSATAAHRCGGTGLGLVDPDHAAHPLHVLEVSDGRSPNCPPTGRPAPLGQLTPVGALALSGTMTVAAYQHISTAGFNIDVLELLLLAPDALQEACRFRSG